MLSMEVPLWHPAVLPSQPHAHLSPLNLQMITKGTKIFHFSIQEVSQMIQIGKDLSFMNLASEDFSSYLAIFTPLLCYSALERSYPRGHQMLLLQPTKIKAKKTVSLSSSFFLTALCYALSVKQYKNAVKTSLVKGKN